MLSDETSDESSGDSDEEGSGSLKRNISSLRAISTSVRLVDSSRSSSNSAICACVNYRRTPIIL